MGDGRESRPVRSANAQGRGLSGYARSMDKDREDRVKAQRNRGRSYRSFIPALVIALFVIGMGTVAAAENVASGATVNIEVGDNFFNPASVNVNVGDTVVWTHKGVRPHDVTSDNGAINSPRRLATGATFSFSPTAAGVINYVCTIHAGMNAALNVQGAPTAAPRTGGGGMANAAMQQWQQLAAIGMVLVLGSATIAALRLRRNG